MLESTVTVFENEGVSDNTGEFVFHLLVMYGCIKSKKIKRLDACYMVESWRFKDVPITPLNFQESTSD